MGVGIVRFRRVSAARSSEAPAPIGGTLGEVLMMGSLRFSLDAPRRVSTSTTAISYAGGDFENVSLRQSAEMELIFQMESFFN